MKAARTMVEKTEGFPVNLPGRVSCATVGLPMQRRSARRGGLSNCLAMTWPVVGAVVAGCLCSGAAVRFFGSGTDRASGFGAGPTGNMAKNRLREAAIDTDVLPGDVTR